MASELLVALLMLAEPDIARAKGEFLRAQKAYDVGDFKVALDGYSEAYRLDPRPAFLFNIAQCHRALNEPEKAVFFYSRFLSHYPPGKAPNDAVAHELLIESEAKVAALKAAAADAPVLPAPAVLAPDLPPPPVVPAPEPAVTHSDDNGVLHQWWFWAAAGVVVAGAITTGALVVARPNPRMTTLPDGNLR